MPAIPRSNIAQRQLPQVRVESDAADFRGIQKGLGHISDVFGQIQLAEDTTESYRLAAEGGTAIKTGLLEAEQQYTNPEEYKAVADDLILTRQEETLSRASNSRVRNRVSALLADNVGNAQAGVVVKYYGFKKDKAEADYDITMTALVKSAAAAIDDESRNREYAKAGQVVGDAKATRVISEKKAVDDAQLFDKRVLIANANAHMAADADGFLIDLPKNPKYLRLDPETREKLATQGRIVAERVDRKADELAKEIKDVEFNLLEAEANFGRVPPSVIDQGLKGEHPYMTPAEARRLSAVNENPPLGGGSDAARGIMMEYHSGSSSFGRISAARAQLNALRKQSDRYDKAIDTALNELQTDERTMIGIGAAQTNRAAQIAVDDYKATKPATLPGLDRFFGNQDARNEAKIKNAVRRGQDPKEVVKQKATEQKNRVDAIPDDVKAMQQLLRK